MKKIFPLMLTLALFLGILPKMAEWTTISAITPVTSANAEDEPQMEETSSVLIAYFTAAENSDVEVISSASVTIVDGEPKGNVRAIADEIAAVTGGNLYSIQTDFKYPGDHDPLINYAREEQNNQVLPTLLNPIENLDLYETIFIGYPTWWYDLPQALYSFFEEYDFSGKTIYLFNSARGSRFSGTIRTIQELEQNATVIEDGISIYGSEYDKNEVDSWLEKIGYQPQSSK